MSKRQLIVFLAFAMSTVALGVDILLPAFADIRAEFGLDADSTAVAGMVTAYMLGMATGQIPFGVLADRFGRRPLLYAGLATYIGGAGLSLIAPNLTLLLLARFIWGFGSASARALSLSIVRDTHESERMARAMSFILAIFLVVPVLAPSIGAAITSWTSWRGAVVFTVLVALGLGFWLGRLPETLDTSNRLVLDWSDIARAVRKVVTTRETIGHMLAVMSLFAVLISFVASSELIFSDVFDMADQFPFIFGGLSVASGVAALINGGLVERVGLGRLSSAVLWLYVVSSASVLALALATGGTPPFWPYVVGLGLILASHALAMPNLNTAAMVPMGAIAGTASAIIGTVATAGGSLLGAVIDQAYDGTVTPLAVGSFIFGTIALGLARWSRTGRQQVQPVAVD